MCIAYIIINYLFLKQLKLIQEEHKANLILINLYNTLIFLKYHIQKLIKAAEELLWS